MSDYKVTAQAFSGDVPALDAGTFLDNHVFNMGYTLTEGSRGHYIRRTGNVLTVSPGIELGAAATITSSVTSSSGASGSTLAVTIRAPFRSDHVIGATTAFSPSPPPDTGPADVLFNGTLTYSGTAATVTSSFHVNYVPDTGPFNSTIVTEFDYHVTGRPRAVSDFNWEWYSDSGYTTRVSTSQGIIVSSPEPGASTTRYLRYQSQGGGSWVNYGAVTFVDPRTGS